MLALINRTRFPAERVVLLDKDGAERLVVAVKATYAVGRDGKAAIAETQDPIEPADVLRGEAGASSILRESELGFPKPATDVVLVGHARAPKSRIQTIDVTFAVASVSRTVRVFGDRTWDRVLGMVQSTPPAFFEALPLVWENAFGGRDVSCEEPKHNEQEPRNPVGKGFRAKRSRIPVPGSPLPNLEDPRSLLKDPEQRPAPVGFGFLGRDWAPRLSYAGTYDGSWRENRMPLLPTDFDERFHTSAPAEFVFPDRLRGGEPILVDGCTTDGRWSFPLPAPSFEIELQFREGRERAEVNLDTVVVDADARQVRMLFKGQHTIHGRLPRLSEIRCDCAREI